MMNFGRSFFKKLMSFTTCFRSVIFYVFDCCFSQRERESETYFDNEPNLGAADRGGSLHLMVSELGFESYVESYVLCAQHDFLELVVN